MCVKQYTRKGCWGCTIQYSTATSDQNLPGFVHPDELWVTHALVLWASPSLRIGNGHCSWESSSPHDLFSSCLMCSNGAFYCLLFKLCFEYKIIHFRTVFPWCSWQQCLGVSHAAFPFPVILSGCWPCIISEERRQAAMDFKKYLNNFRFPMWVTYFRWWAFGAQLPLSYGRNCTTSWIWKFPT